MECKQPLCFINQVATRGQRKYCDGCYIMNFFISFMYPTWVTKLSLQKYKYVQSVLQNFMYINYYKLLTSEEKKTLLVVLLVFPTWLSYSHSWRLTRVKLHKIPGFSWLRQAERLHWKSYEALVLEYEKKPVSENCWTTFMHCSSHMPLDFSVSRQGLLHFLSCSWFSFLETPDPQ